MPSISDIADLVESLGSKPVFVVEDRCLVARNRKSSCRRCVDACIADAIEVARGTVMLHASTCVDCGVCTAVCPTEALIAIHPVEAELVKGALTSAAETGAAVIACARIASKKEAVAGSFAEVPCLGRIHETTLVQLAAQGVKEVLLVDGDCATCRHHKASSFADEACLQASSLVEGQGGACAIRRVTGFPEHLLMTDEQHQEAFAAERRAAFRLAASSMKDSAQSALGTMIAQELGLGSDVPSLSERLSVGDDGRVPAIPAVRHTALIDALDALGIPQADTVESRCFAMVDVDVRACIACGACAAFCPTGALRRDPTDDPRSRISELEFQACDCIACGMCADVCWKKAVSITPSVLADELFGFEPRVFSLR